MRRKVLLERHQTIWCLFICCYKSHFCLALLLLAAATAALLCLESYFLSSIHADMTDRQKVNAGNCLALMFRPDGTNKLCSTACNCGVQIQVDDGPKISGSVISDAKDYVPAIDAASAAAPAVAGAKNPTAAKKPTVAKNAKRKQSQISLSQSLPEHTKRAKELEAAAKLEARARRLASTKAPESYGPARISYRRADGARRGTTS